MFLKQNLDNSNIKLQPLTTSVVVTYMGKMMIQPHCDQRYSPDSNFLDCQNSQEEDTATVILVIGLVVLSLNYTIKHQYKRK
jgi:hypothetical protein